jgi:hypothetical protein
MADGEAGGAAATCGGSVTPDARGAASEACAAMPGDGAVALRGGKARQIQRARMTAMHFDAGKRRTFLEVLAATCNVRLASEACGIANANIYLTRRRDAAFAAEWEAALASGYARLEAEALRYALERVPAALDPHDAGSDPAARDTVAGSAAAALVERRASDADLRFVLATLDRYARAVKGGRAVRVARPSEAETDARLLKLLDTLERQMAR